MGRKLRIRVKKVVFLVRLFSIRVKGFLVWVVDKVVKGCKYCNI